MASPMPVLPDDGSRMVWPGFSVPSASAASTMALAMRSLTDPPGFWPSSLATMRTPGRGAELADVDQRRVADQVEDRRVDRHAGAGGALAPGDGRQDADHVVVGHRCRQAPMNRTSSSLR